MDDVIALALDRVPTVEIAARCGVSPAVVRNRINRWQERTGRLVPYALRRAPVPAPAEPPPPPVEVPPAPPAPEPEDEPEAAPLDDEILAACEPDEADELDDEEPPAPAEAASAAAPRQRRLLLARRWNARRPYVPDPAADAAALAAFFAAGRAVTVLPDLHAVGSANPPHGWGGRG